MKINTEQIIHKIGISGLNELQKASIEAHKTHDNLILLSATGSGKTLAYLLPAIELLNPELHFTQALIVAPTRELALQIEKVFKSITTQISVTCCFGGHKREIEENNLTQQPALIIGTPGRLCDHIRRGNISTERISFLIIDEFDKSLELGFAEDIRFIKDTLKGLKKCTLASATDSETINGFLQIQPFKINFLNSFPKKENQFFLQFLKTTREEKLNSLIKLLSFHGGKSSVIFCNFRDDVETCSRQLNERGIYNVFYHGAMEQRDRETALCKFENGSSDYLVTTDLAARGLDFDHIRYVIHYQLPLDEKSFIHRNGRTARMDKSGTAILLLNEQEHLPPYIDKEHIEEIDFPENEYPLPNRAQWTTLYIPAGKKNKVNKVDIVGFLAHKGLLKMEDIGKINVKDFHAFVAVRRSKVASLLSLIKEEKLKGKKVKFEVAK